jgi:hypothetical protein
MRSPEEFEAFLAGELAARLADLERERRAVAARRDAVRLPAPWKLAIGAAGVALAAWIGDVELVLLALVLPFAIDWIRMLRVPDTATPRIRAELLRRVVEFWDPSFRYWPGEGIPRAEFDASRLFEGETIDRYRGEDLVSGRHGATEFRFSELRAVRLRRRGKRVEEVPVFHGLFFVADFAKHFRGETLVLPDRAERRLGAFGRAFQALDGMRGLRLVQLEDPAFERAFAVYASDETEARYLLSPALVARILRFHENTGAQLRLGFVAGRIAVAVPLAGDLFAVDPSAPLDAAALRRWTGELLFAIGIVDELDLNTRIWSKAPEEDPAPRAAAAGGRAWSAMRR